MPGYLLFNATGPHKYRVSPHLPPFLLPLSSLLTRPNLSSPSQTGSSQWPFLPQLRPLLSERSYGHHLVRHWSLCCLSCCCLLYLRIRLPDRRQILPDPLHDCQLPLGSDHLPTTHRCLHSSLPWQGKLLTYSSYLLTRPSEWPTYLRPYLPHRNGTGSVVPSVLSIVPSASSSIIPSITSQTPMSAIISSPKCLSTMHKKRRNTSRRL